MTKQLSKLINDEAMVIPLYSHGHALLSINGVNGLAFYVDRTRYWWAPNKIWLDKSIR